MRHLRGFASHAAYFWDRNRVRLTLLLALATALVIINGSRGVLDSFGAGFLGGVVQTSWC